jgi:predicted benzoate:H+ symporter BenE
MDILGRIISLIAHLSVAGILLYFAFEAYNKNRAYSYLFLALSAMWLALGVVIQIGW